MPGSNPPYDKQSRPPPVPPERRSLWLNLLIQFALPLLCIVIFLGIAFAVQLFVGLHAIHPLR